MDERAEQALIVERNKQFSVVCYSRAAEDCSENGGWCDSEEEAGNGLKTNAGSLPERDGCVSIATPIICGT